MKATMQLDPGVDVVANRLPNVFIAHHRTGERVFVEQIERLARGLDQTGALVILPEGALAAIAACPEARTPAASRRGCTARERRAGSDRRLHGPASSLPPGGPALPRLSRPRGDHSGRCRAGHARNSWFLSSCLWP